MPHVRANGIRIEYETFGDPRGRPLLLIMGLGQQMIVWHEDFCELLAEQGHYVVRFDNRDAGRSTTFEHAGGPSLFAVVFRFWTGRPFEPVYTLYDMAADAAGLADALELGRVHLVGRRSAASSPRPSPAATATGRRA